MTATFNQKRIKRLREEPGNASKEDVEWLLALLAELAVQVAVTQYVTERQEP